MRFKDPFTIYQRLIKSGRKVYYYHIYSQNGERLSFSTGLSTKTATREYCFRLYKNNQLIPCKITKITFNDYSENWWIWDKCDYICGSIARGGSFSRNYADICRMNLKKHILPVFGKKELKEINHGQIESWLLSFSKKQLSNTTANHSLKILRRLKNYLLQNIQNSTGITHFTMQEIFLLQSLE